FAAITAPVLLAQTPVPTCTVTNIRGIPVSGTFCGGSAISGSTSCTAGAIYSCQSGPAGTRNNCKLVQTCATACSKQLSTNSKATCFSGPAPFTVSPLNTPGGNDINLNVNLAAPHSGAIVNLRIDRGDLVPGAFCAVPSLADNQNSVNFSLSTAVVTS